jgi:hypothetical protein
VKAPTACAAAAGRRGTCRSLTSPPTFSTIPLIHSVLDRSPLLLRFQGHTSQSYLRPWSTLVDTKQAATPQIRPPNLHCSSYIHSNMAEQSINIPQVIVFAVVAFLVYRWYSSKPSANGTRPAANRSVRINPAQIDTIAQMFPQLNRRDIAWDLQRNGGNAAATTERVLSGRSLDSVRISGLASDELNYSHKSRHRHRFSYLQHQHLLRPHDQS